MRNPSDYYHDSYFFCYYARIALLMTLRVPSWNIKYWILLLMNVMHFFLEDYSILPSLGVVMSRKLVFICWRYSYWSWSMHMLCKHILNCKLWRFLPRLWWFSSNTTFIKFPIQTFNSTKSKLNFVCCLFCHIISWTMINFSHSFSFDPHIIQ